MHDAGEKRREQWPALDHIALADVPWHTIYSQTTRRAVNKWDTLSHSALPTMFSVSLAFAFSALISLFSTFVLQQLHIIFQSLMDNINPFYIIKVSNQISLVAILTKDFCSCYERKYKQCCWNRVRQSNEIIWAGSAYLPTLYNHV